MSMISVLHMLVGAVTMCLEEKQVHKITYLEKQVGHSTSLVLANRNNYGRIELDSGYVGR